MAFKAVLVFVTVLLLSSRVSSDLPLYQLYVWPCEQYREYRPGLFCPSHYHFPPLKHIWRPLPPKESDLVPLPAPPPSPLPQAYAPAPTPRAPRANTPTPPPRGNAPAPAPRVKPPAPAPKVAPTPAPPVPPPSPPPSSPPSDKNKPDDVIKKLITGLGVGALMGSGLVADKEVTKDGFEIARGTKGTQKNF